MFARAREFPGLRGVMGNNKLVLLQFPRTYYFFQPAWDTNILSVLRRMSCWTSPPSSIRNSSALSRIRFRVAGD